MIFPSHGLLDESKAKYVQKGDTRKNRISSRLTTGLSLCSHGSESENLVLAHLIPYKRLPKAADNSREDHFYR